MATYQFATITSPEAASYNAATDDLQFTGVTGATATNVSITSAYTLRIISTGASVTLGFGAHQETLTLPDGSKLIFPTDGKSTLNGGTAGDHIYGGPETDELNGLGGSDKLEGGTFNDTLNGGAGRDTLVGDAGMDTYVFAPGDSGVTEGQLDVITDWAADEKLAFTTLDGSAYAETTAATYSAALTAANQQIGAGTADVVAVRVGSDVIVFADTRGDNGTADDAIVLTGKGLEQIAGFNIVRYGGSSPPAPGPPGGTDGTAGDDTIVAPSGSYGVQIFGLAGNDSLKGGYQGSDTLQGGDGADTLDGVSDDNFLWGGAGADVVISNANGDTISLGAGGDLVLMRAGGQASFEGDEAKIVDWSTNEDAIRFLVETRGYAETTAASFSAARTAANALSLQGNGIVSVQVGSDVLVFGNAFTSGRMDSVIRLVGRTLDDISSVNVGIGTAPPPAPPSGVPAAPTRVTTGTATIVGNMDLASVAGLTADDVDDVTESRVVIDAHGLDIIITGSDFSTDATRTQLFGSVTSLAMNQTGVIDLNATFGSTTLQSVVDAIDAGQASALFNNIFRAGDQMTGGASADLLRGYGGDDVISGAGGGDTIYGGTGNDLIYATSAAGGGAANATYLRGEDGNDWIAGGAGFDDIHGNQGSDTGAGGLGDDWVVGGQGSDMLFGETGADIVYGNIGTDTCDGGEGADIVRGGQDDDVLFGGAGDDWLSGDKGWDTITGGVGADTFHSFGDAAVDRIVDFNAAEGDRVQLDPGTQYTLSQDGYDTIISMTGGGKVILANVQLSSLPAGWIFGA